MTTTFCPNCASAAPRAAVDVVFPTPPFPEVTTMTLAIVCISCDDCYSVQRGEFQLIAFKPRLDRPVAQALVHRLCRHVIAVDCQKLGFDPAAENARACVAVRSRHGAAAQRAIDMDGSACHQLGAGADRAEHGHVAIREEY